MPAPMVTEAPGSAAAQADAGAGAPAVIPNPFIAGSKQHVEPCNIDVTTQFDGNTHLLGPFDIPSYGYLRSLLIVCQAQDGTGTAAQYKEDAPWSAIAEVKVQDVGGGQIVGPISGYDLYLLHKWLPSDGGFMDPTRSPYYVTPPTSGNFAFAVRVPLEVSSRDALGALANGNSSTTYKLSITMAAKADVFSTDATTVPKLRVRVYGEFWSVPMPTDLRGKPNSPQPPALGTTMFASKYTQVINAGQNVVSQKRVGNLLRGLILVYRDDSATPVRTTAELPEILTISYDSQPLLVIPTTMVRHYMAERQASATLDAGVLVLDFAHDFDGTIGGELRSQWLETSQATRLEVSGSWGGSGGVLTMLTQDVAPKGAYEIN